ncbi:MAG: SDR family oxidoreductase [Desulfobulbaceae bacterium]|nr:SDR family oxidoreductase [Desulfobulbaceae bacterium]
MRILVTGHKGYIGSVLVPMLTALEHKVHGIDYDLYESSLFGPPPDTIPALQKDIRDIEINDVTGYDAIIHLAGLSNDPLGNLDPDLTHEINYLATVRVAEMAKKAGIKRFLFASSCSIYGASDSQMLDEQSPVNPVTPYAKSKILVEQDLSNLAGPDFSPTFFRCATAHGYSPRIRFDLVINNLVAWAHTTGKVFIKSDGTPWRPFVHIEDICRAFIAVLEVPGETVHNQVLNVGSTAENYQISQVGDYVKEIVPDCHVEYSADAGPDKRCYRVSSEKISKLLPEFEPIWTVQRSIRQLLEHYRSIGLKPEEFEGPRYNRIAHLKHLINNGRLNSSLRWNG